VWQLATAGIAWNIHSNIRQRFEISLCWAACPQTQRTTFIQLEIPVTEAKPFGRTEAQSPVLVSKEFGARRH